MCSRYEDHLQEEMEMEISSLDIQQILKSLDDYNYNNKDIDGDDDRSYMDIKSSIATSHHNNIPPAAAVNKWIQIPTHDLKSEPLSADQLLPPTPKPSSSSSSSCRLISFGSSPLSPLDSVDKLSDLADDVLYNNNNDTNTTTRDPLQAQYHVVAERRRREKLTQLFISLSKILPGLKKLDKASLLDHAIKHMKKLQERLRTLEEETNTTTTNATLDSSPEGTYGGVEEVVDPRGSSDIGTTKKNPIHEIKVKITSSTMLIKLLCDKEQRRLVQKILEELGKLHLIVSDFRVIPFGCNTLDVTILAQIDNGFSCTVKDVTTQLEKAFL